MWDYEDNVKGIEGCRILSVKLPTPSLCGHDNEPPETSRECIDGGDILTQNTKCRPEFYLINESPALAKLSFPAHALGQLSIFESPLL